MPGAGNRVLSRREHGCSQRSPPTWQREHVLTAALPFNARPLLAPGKLSVYTGNVFISRFRHRYNIRFAIYYLA